MTPTTTSRRLVPGSVVVAYIAIALIRQVWRDLKTIERVTRPL